MIVTIFYIFGDVGTWDIKIEAWAAEMEVHLNF
jgi:hypothetical protein